MIEKLDNGATLITLGEGTVYTGTVVAEGSDKPVGICFTNEKGNKVNPEGSVIIQINSISAVSSYMMALVRLLEDWDDDKASEFSNMLKDLKKDLEINMPVEKSK